MVPGQRGATALRCQCTAQPKHRTEQPGGTQEQVASSEELVRGNARLTSQPHVHGCAYDLLRTTGVVGAARGTAHRRAGVRAADAISAPSHGHDTPTA
eukprot:scaffold26464_cov44-Phaeocystis_antarctica.AAC.1